MTKPCQATAALNALHKRVTQAGPAEKNSPQFNEVKNAVLRFKGEYNRMNQRFPIIEEILDIMK